MKCTINVMPNNHLGNHPLPSPSVWKKLSSMETILLKKELNNVKTVPGAKRFGNTDIQYSNNDNWHCRMVKKLLDNLYKVPDAMVALGPQRTYL